MGIAALKSGDSMFLPSMRQTLTALTIAFVAKSATSNLKSATQRDKPGLMLNDADCGFCMKTAAWIPLLGVNVESNTIQAVDLEALGVDPRRAVVEMPYLHASGEVEYGHRAFAAILRTGPFPWRLAGHLMALPLIDPLGHHVYRWVAENRSRMPGGTPSCSIGQ